jgi:hypothetical protein
MARRKMNELRAFRADGTKVRPGESVSSERQTGTFTKALQLASPGRPAKVLVDGLQVNAELFGLTVMRRQRRKSNNPAGRPSTGRAEARLLVTGPESLLAEARAAALLEGCSVTEWWRRAARQRLATLP